MTLDYLATMPRPAAQGPMDISAAKHQMRTHMHRQRNSLFRQYMDPNVAGLMLRDSFIGRCPLPPGAVVGGYWPINDEIDVRPLLNMLADRGHQIAMPVVIKRQTPMKFRRWFPGMQMMSGRFGIPTPPDTFPEIRPDVVLVPLLAFDRQGFRLGRGSGFYDHTLEMLRATGKVVSIGIAFAGQEVPAVPHDVFDQRLDWIVSEHYAFSSQQPGFNPLAAFGNLR